MDIVRRAVVDQLGGELVLDTTPGQGTRFVLRVPLTISIVDVFTFECDKERFCVPVSTVEEIIDVDAGVLVSTTVARDVPHAGIIERRGETLPVMRLAVLLGRATQTVGKALVVRRNNEAIAFAVDRLLGQHEVVIRPLEDSLVRVVGVVGATDLGDGRPTLVLDPYALVDGGAHTTELSR
jgi:two-component system chemotaxis sensor kinase CheA